MPVPNVRLITRDNGVGLSRDLQLLSRALDGIDVEPIAFGTRRPRSPRFEAGLWVRRLWHGPVPLQVSIERIHPRLLPLARRNVLIPNPEWMREDWRPLLPRFDRVWCKTHHAQRLFDAMGCRTRYIGFTSEDRLDSAVPRERAFLHVAGASATKGTQAVLDAWTRHPEWPRLTVVQHPNAGHVRVEAPNVDHRIAYLDDAELLRLQNAHRFHLCPSETEGFGHYLMEAMSVGAVVLATDAEPMNELVTLDRGLLIPAARGEAMGMAHRHRVDVSAIEATVEAALALAQDAQDAIGQAARRFHETHRAAFHARLSEAVRELLPAPVPSAAQPEWSR